MSSNVVDCIFCNIPSRERLMETDRFFVVKDRHPVTTGHLLIIPKVHRLDVFELSSEEVVELGNIILKLKGTILGEDQSVDGFNIGANCGVSAGQTIFHCHVHMIPRRSGDVKNPRGGVRGVIPEKQAY